MSELICIACPNGCRLTVESTAKGLIIRGNKCPKGERYGKDESTDPRRMVTAIVRTGSDEWPCVPVKTESPVSKKIITEMLDTLRTMTIHLPVARGDIVLENYKQCGADVVCTRTIPPVHRGKTS